MNSFFVPKTSSPPGSASPGTASTSSTAPASRSSEPSPSPNAAPLPAVVPLATSPQVPREVPIPQPVLPVIRDVYLRRRRVEEITGLKTPTLYRYMKQGLFPRPHKLGPNTVGWPSSSVLAWFNSRRTAA